MRVIEHMQHLEQLKFPIVTSGTFDGVHVGHQEILRRVVRQARMMNGESVVLTFWPHPRFVLGYNADELKLLTTIEEKEALVAQCGIDYFVKVQFTREFSQMSSEQFINQILVDGIGTRKLIIGYDHRFGKDREGSFEYLQQHQERFGFEIEEIPRQDVDHVGVSSTKIRQALASGDVSTANEYLGRAYSLSGLVTKGDQVGRKIGFPTANIYVPQEYKLIPNDGVFAVHVFLGGERFDGMLNIGQRPTVQGGQRTIEVNIFNFDRDIYGLEIEVHLLKKLREEMRFENLEELSLQLKNDKKNAIEILKNIHD